MAITAFENPLIAFPNSPLSGTPSNTNPDSGPSMFVHGLALLDPRYQFTYNPGQASGKQVSGWLNGGYQTLDQVPATATANNLVTSTASVPSANLPLVSSNTTGVTVSTTITNALTGATVTGLLALDSAMTTVAFVQSGTIQIWDPTKAISRNVVVSSNGNDTSVTYTVRGYDIYGFPLSEAIAGANGTSGTAATTAGKKAFKYIASIASNGTSNSTGLTIGTGDVIGLPLRADRFNELLVSLGNTSIIASTGFVAAVTTTATTTSGDVRGTYSLQSASNGVLRLAVKQSPLVSNVASTTGLLGVTQA